VELVSSFAGSGTVTNQLILGVPGQLALLSLELDADKLAERGVVPAGSWRRLPFGGVVNRTPFIILVRPGNPKNIRDFADLARTGVRVVHPDPLTSGGANWAIVAEYGAGARGSQDPVRAGHDMLLGVWKNVVAQAASARAARTQFENGFGDALITYEQEALWDRARGRLKADVVYPRSTVLSEHTLVRIDRNIATRERDLVDAFSSFLWTEEAQRIFVKYGFRSVNEPLNQSNPAFGRVEDPFRIEDLGGWKRAKKEIVDSIWKDRVLAELKK
jgi:ABC-type sulfate transport system substrate-binding protein